MDFNFLSVLMFNVYINKVVPPELKVGLQTPLTIDISPTKTIVNIGVMFTNLAFTNWGTTLNGSG